MYIEKWSDICVMYDMYDMLKGGLKKSGGSRRA